MHLTKAYTVILFAITITACGGGSSGAATQTPTAMPTQTPGVTPTPTMAASPAPEPVSYGPELIINGGFENDAAGSTLPSGNWRLVTDAGGANATFEVIESTAGVNAHSGVKALEVNVITLGENTYSIELAYGPFDIEKDRTYEYSFWVKGATGTRVDFTVGDDTFAELTRQAYTLNGSDWQEVKLPIRIPASFGQLRLPTHFSIDGNAGQTFYLDDLSLRTVSTNITYSPVNVPSLKALSPDGMPIGVAVPAGSAANSILVSAGRANIVRTHFSQLTAENIMKMNAMQPSQGTFTFDDAEALLDFANTNAINVHGHALVWHNQVPQWMRDFSGDREAWIAMMETHVSTVAGHFQTLGETVVSWDVVNEAFNDTGGYRGSSPDDTGSQDSIWYDNIGEEYIELAFRKAREADPGADLYYNDYNLLFGDVKFDLALAMINDFQARSIPIDGLGFQAHISLNAPTIAQIRQTLRRAVDIKPAIKIKITELDVRVNNGNSSQIFTAELAEAQKSYVHDVVEAYLDVVPPAQRGGITVWGIHDGDTWLINFLGRIEWPLLFLENFEPKPALQGFADALEGN